MFGIDEARVVSDVEGKGLDLCLKSAHLKLSAAHGVCPTAIRFPFSLSPAASIEEGPGPPADVEGCMSCARAAMTAARRRAAAESFEAVGLARCAGAASGTEAAEATVVIGLRQEHRSFRTEVPSTVRSHPGNMQVHTVFLSVDSESIRSLDCLEHSP
jgi:hypothetical protein